MTRYALILAALLTLSPLALPAAEGGTATVMQVKQPATLSSDGKSFAKLKLGSTLRSGAIIRTGEGGRVLLRLADGSKTALGPNSDLALRRLPTGQDPVRATFGLLKGRLRAMVRHLTGRSSFHIETSSAVVAVKGSDIEVGADKKGTELNVLETTGLGINLKALLESGKTSGDGVDLATGQKSGSNGVDVEKPHELSPGERAELLNRYAGMDMSPPAPRETGGNATGQGSAALAAKALQRVDKLITAIEKKGGDASALKTEKANLEAKVEKAADAEENGTGDEASRKYEAVLSALLEVQAVKEGRLPQAAVDELKALKDAADAEREAQEALEQAVDQLMEKGEDLREEVGAEALQEAYQNFQPTEAERQALEQAVQEEIKEAAETLAEVQQELALEQQADNAQGNMLMDKDGFRTQVNSTVLRPDLNTVQRSIYTKREEGPNSGTTEFHHIVSFNNQIGSNWVTAWNMGLNDPANLDGTGYPITWRTMDKLKFFNPSGDCFCLQNDFNSPTDPDLNPLTINFSQSFNEYIQVNGQPRSFRLIADDGFVFPGLPYTDLQTTVAHEGAGFRINYTALDGSFVGLIASFYVQVVNLEGAAFDLGSLIASPPDLRSLAMADFTGLPDNAFLEVTITSPDFGTREISPVFNPAAFRDAFREGWR